MIGTNSGLFDITDLNNVASSHFTVSIKNVAKDSEASYTLKAQYVESSTVTGFKIVRTGKFQWRSCKTANAPVLVSFNGVDGVTGDMIDLSIPSTQVDHFFTPTFTFNSPNDYCNVDKFTLECQYQAGSWSSANCGTKF